MNRLTTGMIVLAFIMAIPLTASASSFYNSEKGEQLQMAAMQHQGHESEMKGDMAHDDMGKHEGHDMHKEHATESAHDMHADHADHGTQGGLVEIGTATVEGVKGVAKVKSYDQAAIDSMAKMGLNSTHHLMVFFSDEKTGADIVAGKVGFRAKGPGDDESKPLMLMQMGKGFGADIALAEKGMYAFEVGTKLADGNKRQFEFDFHNH